MAVKRYQDQLKFQKRRHRLNKISLVAGGVFLLLVGLVYILFFARLWDVRAITINGNQTVSGEELRAIVDAWLNGKNLGLARRANIWWLDYTRIDQHLLANFPKLSNVQTARQSSHALVIQVSERSPSGVWCLARSGNCYYFDNTGVAYAQTGPTEGYIFTTIYDERERTIALGSTVAEQSWRDDLTLAKAQLEKNSLVARRIAIPSDAFDEFTIQTSQDWRILFSINTNIVQQVEALAQQLKKLTAEQLAKAQYFDLRIQDRIYYK